MHKTLITLAIAGLTFAAPSSAQTIEMSSPSDSVVALAFLSSACPAPAGGVANEGEVVNSMIQGDGSIGSFQIPAGEAFMLTSVDFVSTGVPTGKRAGFVLRTVDSGIVIAEGYSINTGEYGPVSGTTLLSPPMRVTSSLCLDRTTSIDPYAARTWIRGFFVKDK